MFRTFDKYAEAQQNAKKMQELEQREDCKTILFTGDSCGKSSIINSYLHPNSFPKAYKQTGVDNFSCQINVGIGENAQSLILSIWDFGQFHSHPIQYEATAKRADIICLCFDTTERYTFLDLQRNWLFTLKELKVKNPIILVGTKTDLKQTKDPDLFVKDEEIIQMVKKFDLECYFETSITEPESIKKLMTAAVNLMLNPIIYFEEDESEESEERIQEEEDKNSNDKMECDQNENGLEGKMEDLTMKE